MPEQFETEADKTIGECLSLENPKSFFLFAGAGSGKTRSLVNALNHIEATIGSKLCLRGKRVAVITFTNAAADEITRRVQHNSLFAISTIHSFAWELIKGFDVDIKVWLKAKLQEKIDEYNRKNHRGTATKVQADHDKRVERLNELDSVKHFTYDPSPSAINAGKDSLSHADVLGICASFLIEKSLMAKILVQRFPILLIDESQDTDKDLMEAFLSVQQKFKNEFSLGLFGDTKQRIYFGGKKDLGITDWSAKGFLTPSKPINHRSGSRIIKLTNQIGNYINDGSPEQIPVPASGTGVVRLFVVPTCADKAVAEKKIKEKMAEITRNDLWKKGRWDKEEGATLVLEHRMAAARLGFVEMWDSLKHLKEFESVKEGTLPEINWFANFIAPLLQTDNSFVIANIVKKNNKALFKMVDCKLLMKIDKNVKEIRKAYSANRDITFGGIVKIIREGGVFEFPRKFDEESENFAPFLETKFSQIFQYSSYVNQTSGFRTHHGVKGLQFDCVMAIIDDVSNWRSYNHSQLFLTGKANEATLRLLYVICTRAKKSLAIVLYANTSTDCISRDLFADNEIIALS